jgi:hypothetical protein
MKTPPNILAIDPSIRACGWATIYQTEQIYKYELPPYYIEAGTIKSKDKNIEIAIIDICSNLALELRCFDIDIVIIEKPKLYENWSENKKQGVEKVLMCYGAIIQLIGDKYSIWTPTVQEWKGQLPKDVSHKNTAKVLDREKIDYSYTGLDHNAKDAIALIVAYLQKERFI